MNIEPVVWGGAGAVLGVFTAFILGLFKIRHDDRKTLTDSQQTMIAALFERCNTHDDRINQFNKLLMDQRESYERRIRELRDAHSVQMRSQRLAFEKRIRELQHEIDQIQKGRQP